MDQFLEVTLRQLLPDDEEEADDDKPILEEPPEPRLSHAEQVKLAIENLPPPPPPSEYPLRVIVEQEDVWKSTSELGNLPIEQMQLRG